MATKDIEAIVQDPEVRPLFFEKRRFTDGEGEEREVEVQRNYLRSWQREETADEIRKIQDVLDDPIAKKGITDIGRVTRRLAGLKRDLKTQSPPPLTANQRDKVDRLNRLCLAQFREGMPTDEQMRRKPPGAVDHHRKWDEQNKRAVLFWKTTQLLKHPDSQDVDLCNVERFRPSPGTRNLNVDAQIPGVFALSPEAKDKYDEVFDKDWRAKETQEDFVKRMAAQGIQVEFKRARPLRAPRESKTYDCSCSQCQTSGRIWTGPMAAARLKRHQNEIAREQRVQEATA